MPLGHLLTVTKQTLSDSVTNLLTHALMTLHVNIALELLLFRLRLHVGLLDLGYRVPRRGVHVVVDRIFILLCLVVLVNLSLPNAIEVLVEISQAFFFIEI